jgi:hypothetical protein
MAEELGTVQTCGMGLLVGWWWPIRQHLVFDQTATPVPEIMDGYLSKQTTVIQAHKKYSNGP